MAEAAPVEQRSVLLWETLLVVAVAVGVAIVRSAVSLVAALTAPAPLAAQTATLVSSRYPDRPYLDLAYQIVTSVALVLPALLAVHLARRDSSWDEIGLRVRRPVAVVAGGLALAAVVGSAGLALYLASRALGLSVEIRVTTLTGAWWTIPVLVLAAGANAVLEELVVVGYLLRRLDQLGLGAGPAAVVSASLRGGYHMYQGLGGVVGNLVMGLLFARLFQRTRSIVPLIVAHWAIDVVAFVGYALLASRVAWL